ncbi:hypothetical protein BC827DRAFT_177842 [Russula dissimulans]|nr:hypothetical protein BC827DRAFT_177842 [Russula dissimulans]
MSVWKTPPTRRELTLVLFCVAIFIVAFNASATFTIIGLDLHLLNPFSSKRAPLGADGRRPEGYRDRLENEIFGEWGWEPGRVAGVKESEADRLLHGKTHGHPNAYVRGEGRSGAQAMWLLGVGEGKYGTEEGLGSTSVNDDFLRWGQDVPRTELRQHVAGFTILDNVTMLSGTFYIVVDDPTSMPSIGTIGSSRVNHNEPPRDVDWQILPASNAPSKLGTYGGRIHGVTFVSYDAAPTTDAHTLPSLVRLYSSLNVSSPHSLSPPHRIFFPSIPTFSDPRPQPDDETVPRHRSGIGVVPQTLKAAYPSLAGPQFAEDFADFAGLVVPVLLDRVVIADRGAARRGGLSARTAPFTALRASEDWFESERRTLAEYFLGGEDEGAAAARTHTVTYLSRQDGVQGDRLRASDHAALVEGLRGLGRTGVKVNIVDENASWTERMRAIVQSTVVLSVFGEHLGDAIFMRRTPQSTFVEFFPPNEFNRDWEIVVRSMGIKYVAWQGNQKYTGENLPDLAQTPAFDDIALDAQAVVRAITEEMNRVAAE